MGMPITTKGQVTIPKPVRDHLGLAPGSRVEFSLDETGRVIVTKADDADANLSMAERIARVRGIAKTGMSTDEIMLLLRGEPD